MCLCVRMGGKPDNPRAQIDYIGRRGVRSCGFRQIGVYLLFITLYLQINIYIILSMYCKTIITTATTISLLQCRKLKTFRDKYTRIKPPTMHACTE